MADDESDGNALQGELVAAHVRAGKTIETLDPARRTRRGRLAAAGAAGLPRRGGVLVIVAAGVVAMAGAFSRCGRRRSASRPRSRRARGLRLAEGGSLAPALYLTVEAFAGASPPPSAPTPPSSA